MYQLNVGFKESKMRTIAWLMVALACTAIVILATKLIFYIP